MSDQPSKRSSGMSPVAWDVLVLLAVAVFATAFVVLICAFWAYCQTYLTWAEGMNTCSVFHDPISPLAFYLLFLLAVCVGARWIWLIAHRHRPGYKLTLWLLILGICIASLAPTNAQYARLALALFGPGKYSDVIKGQVMPYPNHNQYWPLLRGVILPF